MPLVTAANQWIFGASATACCFASGGVVDRESTSGHPRPKVNMRRTAERGRARSKFFEISINGCVGVSIRQRRPRRPRRTELAAVDPTAMAPAALTLPAMEPSCCRGCANCAPRLSRAVTARSSHRRRPKRPAFAFGSVRSGRSQNPKRSRSFADRVEERPNRHEVLLHRGDGLDRRVAIYDRLDRVRSQVQQVHVRNPGVLQALRRCRARYFAIAETRVVDVKLDENRRKGGRGGWRRPASEIPCSAVRSRGATRRSWLR